MKKIMMIALIYCVVVFLYEKHIKKLISSLKVNRKIEVLLPFLLAVIVYISLTFGKLNMGQNSGDAADIWKTIVSWYTDNIYGSYVMYKGIHSVYPYVWLYKVAKMVGVNEWLFVKLFFTVTFAYVAAVGFPNMIELLTNKETNCYKRGALVILFWYFWYPTNALTNLMVDLPCLAYFVILINSALKIYRKQRRVYNYVLLGFFGGLCMTASGQYTLPAVCIYIFTLIVILQFCKHNEWNKRQLFQCVIIIAICTASIIIANNYFECKVTNTLRSEGAWIPSSNDWLKAGLSRFRYAYRQGPETTIPSPRNAAILDAYFNGEVPDAITTLQYIKIFTKYPLDFALNYLNAFFIVLSPDFGQFNFWPLFIFYSMLYIALTIGVSKCNSWKKFFSPMFWIGFSFLWAVVPMLVMNIEARTCMQIQGIIIALAICDDYMWNKLKQVLKEIFIIRKISFERIPYRFILYIIFVMVCFVHISTLYELCGADSTAILIHF